MYDNQATRRQQEIKCEPSNPCAKIEIIADPCLQLGHCRVLPRDARYSGSLPDGPSAGCNRTYT
jgi:hypothetical protein